MPNLFQYIMPAPLSSIKSCIKRTRAFQRYERFKVQRVFRRTHLRSKPLRIILGAAQDRYPGWVATNRTVLDITDPWDWWALFKRGEIHRLLAEHVFEHLSVTECSRSFALCHRHLQRGGLLRIAVPDGNRPDQRYRAHVQPPQDGHKTVFDVNTLVSLLESVGFVADAVEFFDSAGNLHTGPWDAGDGMIKRSSRFDRREAFRLGDVCYTSLIVDARKP